MLEALGLGDLSVEPGDDPLSDTEAIARYESDLAKAKRDAEQVRTSLAEADKSLSQARADLDRAEQSLVAAREAAAANVEQLALARQRTLGLSKEGQAMIAEFNARRDLIARLGAVHEDLKKLSESSEDAKLAATHLAKVLADSKEVHAEHQRQLASKAVEFNGANQEWLRLERDTQQKRDAITAAESERKDNEQRLVEARRKAARLQEELASAESRVGELTAALETAKRRRATEVAAER